MFHDFSYYICEPFRKWNLQPLRCWFCLVLHCSQDLLSGLSPEDLRRVAWGKIGRPAVTPVAARRCKGMSRKELKRTCRCTHTHTYCIYKINNHCQWMKRAQVLMVSPSLTGCGVWLRALGAIEQLLLDCRRRTTTYGYWPLK